MKFLSVVYSFSHPNDRIRGKGLLDILDRAFTLNFKLDEIRGIR